LLDDKNTVAEIQRGKQLLLGSPTGRIVLCEKGIRNLESDGGRIKIACQGG